ncbi:hypothetical protein RRG08_057533 [Elysia crispata]|uniref:Uncharacterized protein n=1 Tax=Elysia crispata TaxID=231223 RepID=A0AAE1EB58_9GAST|nr:hypothetical protein RRG08_057533 [Elysia crispata]
MIVQGLELFTEQSLVRENLDRQRGTDETEQEASTSQRTPCGQHGATGESALTPVYQKRKRMCASDRTKWRSPKHVKSRRCQGPRTWHAEM